MASGEDTAPPGEANSKVDSRPTSSARSEEPAKAPEKTEWVGLRVLDAFGQPLYGATVRIIRGGSVLATATVGNSGHVRVDGLVLTGQYDVEVAEEEIAIAGDPGPADAAETAVAEEEPTTNDTDHEHRC